MNHEHATVDAARLQALADRCAHVFGDGWSADAARALHQEIELLVDTASMLGMRAVADAALELTVYLCSCVEEEHAPGELARVRIADMTRRLVEGVSAHAAPPSGEARRARPARPAKAEAPLVLQLTADSGGHLQLAAALGRRQLRVDHVEDLRDLARVLERRTANVLLIDATWVEHAAEVLRLVDKVGQGRLSDPACLAVLPAEDRNRRLFALRAGIERVIDAGDPDVVAQAVGEFLQERRRAAFRVLVVEDDRAQAMFAQAVLAYRGIETRIAASAAEAFDMVGDYRPDLVLLDLHLPDRNGIEVAQLLRERPGFDYVQIVFLTGEPSMEEQFRAIRLGADDWVAKPVKPRHLLAVVDSRAERARRLRANVATPAQIQQRAGEIDRARLVEDFNRLREGGALLVALAPAAPIATGTGLDFVSQGLLLAEIAEAVLAQPLLHLGVCRAEPALFLALVDGKDADGAEERLSALRQELERRRWLSNAYPMTVEFALGAVQAGSGSIAFDLALKTALEQLQRARAAPDRLALQLRGDGGGTGATPAQQLLRRVFGQERFDEHAVIGFTPLLPIRGYLTGQYMMSLGFAGTVHKDAIVIARDDYLAYARDHGGSFALDRWLFAHALHLLRERLAANKASKLSLLVPLSAESLQDERFIAWLRTEMSRQAAPARNLMVLADPRALNLPLARVQQVLTRLAEASVPIAIGPLQASKSDLELCRLNEPTVVLLEPAAGAALSALAPAMATAREYGKSVVLGGIDSVARLTEVFTLDVHYATGDAVSPALQEPEFEFPAR